MDMATLNIDHLGALPGGAEEVAKAPMVDVLRRLCDKNGGAELIGKVIGGLLKRHMGSTAMSADSMISGDLLVSMAQGLERAWGLAAADSLLLLRILRRDAKLHADEDGAKPRPTVAGAAPGDGDVDDDAQPPISVGGLKRALPKALQRLLAKYVEAPRKEGAIVRRDSFLRSSSCSLEDRYQPKSQIGSGAFGTVALCVYSLTGELRAVKSLPKDSAAEVAVEFKVLSMLDHPNIVRVFEVFEDKDSLHIAMEPVLGGTLKDATMGLFSSKSDGKLQKDHRRKRFPTGDGLDGVTEDDDEAFIDCWIAEVMRQLLMAVRYSHESGIVHRDLKPTNVLMAQAAPMDDMRPRVIVCDFGVAEMCEAVGTGNCKGIAGTPQYMAPEVFLGGGSDSKADLWSLGVMLYEMLTEGQLPFQANNILLLSHHICGSKVPPLLETMKSGGGKELCELLLQKAPEKRPTAAQARSRSEKWLVGFGSSGASRWEGAMGQQAKQRASKTAGALRSLQQRSHFDHVVMACVASQLNLTQLASLNSIFEKYDTDCSGTLDVEELGAALRELGLPEADAAVVVRELDKDNSGGVTYTELAAGCLDLRKEEVVSHLRVAFSIFDLDGSGFIDREELKAALQTSGEPSDKSRAAKSVFPSRPPEGGTGEGGGSEALGPAAGAGKAAAAGGAPGLGGGNEIGGGGGTDFIEDLLPDGMTVDELWEDLDTSQDGLVSFDEFVKYLLRRTLGE